MLWERHLDLANIHPTYKIICFRDEIHLRVCVCACLDENVCGRENRVSVMG